MQLNGFPIERKKLSELIKAPYNPRRISPEQAASLQRSLTEFGTVEPIILNKQTGHIVGGHQRLDALQSLGETETDVLIVDMSEEREQALNIALNKISGDWDNGMLSDVLLSMHEELRGLTGFDDLEINQLLTGFGIKGQNDIAAEWQGMPEFDQQDKMGVRDIIVHFKTHGDVEEFARLLNQKISPKAKYIWFPEAEIETYMDKRY